MAERLMLTESPYETRELRELSTQIEAARVRRQRIVDFLIADFGALPSPRQRQPRRWLESLAWFVSPLLCAFRGTELRVASAWRDLLYVHSAHNDPEVDRILEMLNDRLLEKHQQ